MDGINAHTPCKTNQHIEPLVRVYLLADAVDNDEFCFGLSLTTRHGVMLSSLRLDAAEDVASCLLLIKNEGGCSYSDRLATCQDVKRIMGLNQSIVMWQRLKQKDPSQTLYFAIGCISIIIV